jgi:hypothetical protein
VDPTSLVLAVLVVTLLLPGLVMLTAVVVRFLFRGSKNRQGGSNGGEWGQPLPLAPPRERAGVSGERKD